jgi:hypothetical protein
MSRIPASLLAAGTSASILTAWSLTSGNADDGGASPIYGARIPTGYRQRELIAPAKLAWKHVESPEFEPAPIPGAATTVQIMVKDSKKYAAAGGSAGSSTTSPLTKLSMRPALPVIRLV